MSPTSAGGGTNTKTGGEHISRLVETPLFQFCLWQNWNNGVIIFINTLFMAISSALIAKNALKNVKNCQNRARFSSNLRLLGIIPYILGLLVNIGNFCYFTRF